MVSSNYTTVKSSMEVGFPNQLWNTYSRPLSLSSCILPNLPIVYYYYVFSIVWLSTSLPFSGLCQDPLLVQSSFAFENFYDSETFFPTIYSTMMTDLVHISSQGIVQNLYKKNSYLWSILFLLSVSWNYSISPKFSHFFTWIDVLRFTSSHLSSSCSIRFGFSQSPLYFNVATCTVVNSPSAGSFIPLSEDPEKGEGGVAVCLCCLQIWWTFPHRNFVLGCQPFTPSLQSSRNATLVVYQASL